MEKVHIKSFGRSKRLLTLIMVLATFASFAQTKNITGVVTDSEGQPLPGVTVVLKGTTIGVITDINGRYALDVPADAQSLSISFVGMKTQELAINGRSQINVSLEEDAVGLDEVVVVGYGVQKKGDVINSVATMKTDGLAERPIGKLDQALVGQMAGVRVK